MTSEGAKWSEGVFFSPLLHRLQRELSQNWWQQGLGLACARGSVDARDAQGLSSSG